MNLLIIRSSFDNCHVIKPTYFTGKVSYLIENYNHYR